MGNWGSLGKEGTKGNSKSSYNPKGPGKGSRMQELEREIEVLRKERVRLESNLREAACDAQNLHELRAELASLKVRCLIVGLFALHVNIYLCDVPLAKFVTFLS